VFRGHHVAGTSGFGLFLVAMGNALFVSALLFAVYLAIEPFVRRHWPRTIISWSRLLAGRFRDPLLGRDLLTGVVLGVVWCTILKLHLLVSARLGAELWLGSLEYLLGVRGLLGAWLGQALVSIQAMLLFFFVLFAFRVLLKREWLAAVAFVALFTTSRSLGTDLPGTEPLVGIAIYGIAALAVVRFGLVALASGLFVADLVLDAPVASSLSTWYAGSMVVVFASVLALAAWGFHTATAGRWSRVADLFD
jgi:serine/threonine-protein kinase